MRDIAIIGIILILFYFSMRSAYASCLTYWWFGIFRPQEWIYTDISSFHLPLLATIIFFIGSVLRGHFPKVNDKQSATMVLFYLLGLIASIIYGCSTDLQVIKPIEYLALLFIAIFLTIDIVKTRNQLFGLICVITLSLAFYTGKGGIVAMLAGGSINYGANNLGGMFTGSNAYAMGTAMLLFFMIFLFKESAFFKEVKWLPKQIKHRNILIKMFMGLMIVGSVFNVVSLYSRGAAIAMFCGFLVLYLLSNKKLKGFIIAVPLSLIIVATVPIPEGYKERIASAFVGQDELDGSAVSRTYYWDIAGRIISDYPIGVGSNCYRQYYNLYATDAETDRFGMARDVHSSHVNAYVDSGYLGVFVWCLLFIISLNRLFSLRRLLKKHKDKLTHYSFYYHLCEATIAAQIVYILGGSFYTLTYSDLIWLIWGLTIILTNLIKREVECINNDQSKNNDKTQGYGV